MVKKIPRSKFDRKIEFSTVKSIENEMTGDTTERLVTLASLWCSLQRRSMAQQFQLVGTNLEDTITVVINHNEVVQNAKYALLNGKKYEIITVSPDDTTYFGYDYIVLRKASGA